MKKITFILFFICSVIQAQVLNENFNNATCAGNGAFNNGCVPNWGAADGSPSINGLANNANAWMWSVQGVGEAIATNYCFIQGEAYTVSFSIRTDDRNTNDPNVANNATVNLVATNNSGVVTGNPNGDSIFNATMGGFLNNWQNVTVNFIPDNNYNQLWIFPFMAQPRDANQSQAEMAIDNIVITKDNPLVDFHFEHANGVEDTIFNICEDVFLDGSTTLNTGSYYMDIWRVNNDNSLSWLSAQGTNGWLTGQPTLVNVTQTFVNDLENPVTFQPDETYEVKLAINHPTCGWVSQTMQFTLIDVSPEFSIVDYFCHDGVYDVTATTLDQNPNHGWGLWETSVEGSIDDDDVIGQVSGQSSSQLPALTTVTFTDLDPNKFYFIKHGIWGDNCEWREQRIPVDRDCCNDKPYVEPYWSHPDCPEVVCTADTWPLIVLDENDLPINGSGVTINWVNTDTNSLPSMTGTWNYVGPNQHWEITITYDDGCVYILNYFEACCNDDIFIEAVECPPTTEDIKMMENYAAVNKKILSADKYQLIMSGIASLKENSLKKDCDPCDIGFVLVYLVDSNGDPIDPSLYDSILWSNGDTTPQSIAYSNQPLSVTATQINDDNQCDYTANYLFECEKEVCDVTTPTNLHCTVFGNTTQLRWDDVAGAVGYELFIEPNGCCRNEKPISLAPIMLNDNTYNIPSNINFSCFSWRVRAKCKNGKTSPFSPYQCFDAKTKCPVVGIIVDTHDVIKNKVSIYPNPNNGIMDIKVELEEPSDLVLNVYTFDGIKVRTINYSKTTKAALDVKFQSNLPNGLYFFIFNTKDETITKRIVIE